jgi:REP element-mobilizing transposase RayT
MPTTYSNLLYHIVFSTKQRLPLIAEDWKEELYRYIGSIIRAEGGVQLEIGGINDHIHILAKFKPAISVSEMLNKIKANSSKWANDHKMQMRKCWLARRIRGLFGERVASSQSHDLHPESRGTPPKADVSGGISGSVGAAQYRIRPEVLVGLKCVHGRSHNRPGGAKSCSQGREPLVYVSNRIAKLPRSDIGSAISTDFAPHRRFDVAPPGLRWITRTDSRA